MNRLETTVYIELGRRYSFRSTLADCYLNRAPSLQKKTSEIESRSGLNLNKTKPNDFFSPHLHAKARGEEVQQAD